METGFIGLGAMGKYMAINLSKAGYLKTVFNRTTKKTEIFKKEYKCLVSNSPSELATRCRLIIISVSRDQDVLDIVKQLITKISSNSIIVDTSTTSSKTAKKATDLLKKVNSYFLDAPVSGGVEGAKNGTLAMMVGGEKQVLKEARPVLNVIAKNIVHIGPTGSGQATKAVNQIMAAGMNQAVTEALAFGEAMNLPMEKVIKIVSTGAAGNWFLDHRGETMLSGKFEPGFKLSLHQKDLSICQSMVGSISENALPIIEMTLIHYKKLIDDGYGDEDISALFRLKQANLKK
ncbi:MAG: oxidoreductase [Legionellales bacterium]|jgi:3-hydroxyisobutyrate dehydrogenase|nr:oxidoreductase [Legionellales bacterium]|tara:strand:- start:160 stop:1029 length:870 start_codon:yes stop_codon:yes gene_type:complete